MRRSIDAVTDDLWLIKVDGVHLNLTKDDQRRLKGSLDNGWLNDTIMDDGNTIILYLSYAGFWLYVHLFKMQAVVSSKMPKHNTISSANQNIQKNQMFKLQVLEYFN